MTYHDPETFSVPCTTNKCSFDAMLDLGALINEHCTSTWHLEDVLVQVSDMIFPVDFYVLDMKDELSSKGPKALCMMEYTIFEAMKHPTKNHSVFYLDVIDQLGDDYMNMHSESLDFDYFTDCNTKVQIFPSSLFNFSQDSMDALLIPFMYKLFDASENISPLRGRFEGQIRSLTRYKVGPYLVSKEKIERAIRGIFIGNPEGNLPNPLCLIVARSSVILGALTRHLFSHTSSLAITPRKHVTQSVPSFSFEFLFLSLQQGFRCALEEEMTSTVMSIIVGSSVLVQIRFDCDGLSSFVSVVFLFSNDRVFFLGLEFVTSNLLRKVPLLLLHTGEVERPSC
ncbi:hypothetical protein CR513_29192, partial [Mucuna pruriens]